MRRADVSIFSRPAPDTRPPPRPAPVPAPTLHAPGERGPTSGHWCPRVLEAEVGRVTTEEGCHYKHVSTLSPSQLPFTSPQDMMYGRPCLLFRTSLDAAFSTYLTFLCTSFSKLSRSFVGTFLNLTTMHAYEMKLRKFLVLFRKRNHI